MKEKHTGLEAFVAAAHGGVHFLLRLPPFVIRAVYGGHFPARRGYVNSPQPWKMPIPNPPETEGVVDELIDNRQKEQ